MVDAKSGSNLLYLPLDKLIAQAAATDAAAASAKASAATAASPQPPAAAMLPPEALPSSSRDSRSRDTSREREGR
jgi:membrane protease subunit HflK